MKPEFVKIGDKKYKINTDFKVALECNEISENETIGEYEKALAVIYKLFNDEGLKDKYNHNKLLELGLKYLLCGKESEKQASNEKPNMCFKQDWGYIVASFRSDYHIDLENGKIHWWTFNDLLNGLTEECVLNRVRYIRDYDISEVKDTKERQAWIKRKKLVELKTDRKITTEQEESAEQFLKLAKLDGRK